MAIESQAPERRQFTHQKLFVYAAILIAAAAFGLYFSVSTALSFKFAREALDQTEFYDRVLAEGVQSQLEQQRSVISRLQESLARANSVVQPADKSAAIRDV